MIIDVIVFIANSTVLTLLQCKSVTNEGYQSLMGFFFFYILAESNLICCYLYNCPFWYTAGLKAVLV